MRQIVRNKERKRGNETKKNDPRNQGWTLQENPCEEQKAFSSFP
jgi:hypothetical protein